MEILNLEEKIKQLSAYVDLCSNNINILVEVKDFSTAASLAVKAGEAQKELEVYKKFMRNLRS